MSRCVICNRKISPIFRKNNVETCSQSCAGKLAIKSMGEEKLKSTARPQSIIDSIDIRILHHINIKPCSIMKLTRLVNIAHQPIKRHLAKLQQYDLIEIIRLKGRKREVWIKTLNAKHIGNLILRKIKKE